MSNYDVTCVFPEFFLLKIGKTIKKSLVKKLTNVKFQL